MKAALIHYAQRLAYQHAAKMIRVNAVSPGNTYFDGGVWQNAEKNLPDLYKHQLSLNPTGRMAKPEEIGRGIVFLASPASSFTTGTNLVIDGALTRGVQFQRDADSTREGVTHDASLGEYANGDGAGRQKAWRRASLVGLGGEMYHQIARAPRARPRPGAGCLAGENDCACGASGGWRRARQIIPFHGLCV
jgi:hypothetical protein